MAKKKEKTAREYVYTTPECKHVKLIKLAPMWYACSGCGKIFNFILSLQFTLEEALKYHEGIVRGIVQNKKKIERAEKQQEKKDIKAEKEVREMLKKADQKKAGKNSHES